ncbi:hypothetical protein PHPALM_31139 [Phytophthora palmivora]|uniref:Uncharacterized protein n=1 Tax=Phytophthora palmivora TaxID=4796 RepID=A0A2P4X3D7_9STRA|nr:hypothetical protein PHPALM_31139 [Phytophthora palmivora]
MVINQTAKKFSIRGEKRAITNSKQWKWLAYGLFSKRARAYSALESAALNQIDSLGDTDVEAFLSVLNSAHPEEALCGTPAVVVKERNATLKSGSSIQWCFSRGQPAVDDRHKRIKVESVIRCVRTFSNDGESEWVNAMIPGLGRCQIQRDDLIFDLSSAIETRPGALKTLTIGFNREEDTYPRSDGLPQFLAAIGSTLKNLTLDGPRQEIDENVIIRNCPNLHKLSLCGGIVDVQLDFSDYRYNNLPVPELQQCHWHDVRTLAADFSNVNNTLSKIVRRLRLRLNDRCKGWRCVAGGYAFDNLPEDIKAVLRMLSHLKPIDLPAKLPRNVKLAFLSVISTRTIPARAKRARRTPQAEAAVGGIVLRQVYFRTTKHYWEPYDDFYDDYYEESDEEEQEDDA